MNRSQLITTCCEELFRRQRAAHPANSGARLWLVLFFVLSVALIIAIVAASRRPISDPDAFDYLQMALHVADGEGYVSGQAEPGHIRWFREHGFEIQQSPTVPILYRYPLPVLGEAGFIRLGLSPYAAAHVYSLGGYLLFGGTVFLIIWHFFKKLSVTVVLTLAILLNESVIGNAISGMTDSTAMSLFALTILSLISHSRLRSKGLFLGLIMAISVLNRTQALFYTFPVMFVGLWIFRTEHEKRNMNEYCLSVLISIGVFMSIMGPHFLRNYQLTGHFIFSFDNSYNLLLGTDLPAREICLENAHDTSYIWKSYSSEIGRKFIRNLLFVAGDTHPRNVLVVNKLLVVPFVLGILVSLRRRSWKSTNWEWRQFRSTLLVWSSALLFNFLGVCLFLQIPRLYAPFWFMVPILSFVGLCVAMRHVFALGKLRKAGIRWMQHMVICAVILSVIYVALNMPCFREVKTPASIPNTFVESVRESRSVICKKEKFGIIVSDLSWVTAVEYYGCKLLSVKLPLSHKDLRAVVEGIGADAVLVSQKTLAAGLIGKELVNYIMVEFPNEITLKDGSKLFLRG